MTRRDLAEWASRQTCPCGNEGLEVEWRIRVKPPGTFSLAGTTLKASAYEVPVLRCPSCRVESEGRRA